MKIYLDMCSLQRPLDGKAQLRILVEAEAVLGVLALCETGQIELVSSDVLRLETERNPNPVRRSFAVEVLSKARQDVSATEKVQARAARFTEIGIKPLDALHLASAIESGADYFCTCDDKLLKKAKATETSGTKVVSPLELIEEIEI